MERSQSVVKAPQGLWKSPSNIVQCPYLSSFIFSIVYDFETSYNVAVAPGWIHLWQIPAPTGVFHI
jgi:hypothetical protein